MAIQQACQEEITRKNVPLRGDEETNKRVTSRACQVEQASAGNSIRKFTARKTIDMPDAFCKVNCSKFRYVNHLDF